MCEFCENIPTIKKWGLPEDELPCEDNDVSREKVVLARYKKKIRFYGFNEYHYESDALYTNVEVKYCPLCGRKLSEETERMC